jgi:hypothetical protein
MKSGEENMRARFCPTCFPSRKFNASCYRVISTLLVYDKVQKKPSSFCHKTTLLPLHFQPIDHHNRAIYPHLHGFGSGDIMDNSPLVAGQEFAKQLISFFIHG